MNGKSSKIKKIIVVVLLFLIVNIVPVEARHSHRDRISISNETYNKILIIIIIIIAVFIVCAMIFEYFQMKKILNMHNEIKPKLQCASNKDQFWNEERLLKEIKYCFIKIQAATVVDEPELLERCLTPSLKDKWKYQTYWQEHYWNKKWLKDREVKKLYIVDLSDDQDDNNLDYFWVFLELYKREFRVKGPDYHEYDKEFWKFKRIDGKIYLDSVMSENEFMRKC